MLSKEEEKFILYWQNNREKEKRLLSPVFAGISVALLSGIGILLLLKSGWYKRASMVANMEFNPAVFLIAIFCIGFFAGIFYKKHRWDINEQRYKELIYKKQKETSHNEDAAN